jgi:hypothetical protein
MDGRSRRALARCSTRGRGQSRHTRPPTPPPRTTSRTIITNTTTTTDRARPRLHAPAAPSGLASAISSGVLLMHAISYQRVRTYSGSTVGRSTARPKSRPDVVVVVVSIKDVSPAISTRQTHGYQHTRVCSSKVLLYTLTHGNACYPAAKSRPVHMPKAHPTVRGSPSLGCPKEAIPARACCTDRPPAAAAHAVPSLHRILTKPLPLCLPSGACEGASRG